MSDTNVYMDECMSILDMMFEHNNHGLNTFFLSSSVLLCFYFHLHLFAFAGSCSVWPLIVFTP